MVDPKILCSKHLCGEHVELHMFLGHLKRKKRVCGYITNNLLEMTSLYTRHKQLAEEMTHRGYKHKSPIVEKDCECIYDYPDAQLNYKINKKESLKDLLNRCSECKILYGSVSENVSSK